LLVGAVLESLYLKLSSRWGGSLLMCLQGAFHVPAVMSGLAIVMDTLASMVTRHDLYSICTSMCRLWWPSLFNMLNA
jgi:hypothetical protein